MFDRQLLEGSGCFARGADGARVDGVRVRREWTGDSCRAVAVNEGADDVAVLEVVLAAGPLPIDPATGIYGEGYQKLSEYGGSIANPEFIGTHKDHEFYRFAHDPADYQMYNLVIVDPRSERAALMGFASCRRFQGIFRFRPDRFEIVMRCEGLTLRAGEQWEMEELVILADAPRGELLGELGRRIEANHPRLEFPHTPTGWCSWYRYWADISAGDILANMRAIKQRGLELKYVQIDDGYEAHLGDWLVPGEKFPGGMESLCATIREAGFSPAIWLAPFAAERDAQVVAEHPEWFVKDETGRLLPSDEVTFGGWRAGPWYMLDGTHPGAQEYLEHVFRTMREQWGCEYFKLDGNMWGAIPAGVRYDRDATCVEAYRRGMEAIRRGAGDAFILGCNCAVWPSLGTVHGMRLTNDVHVGWEGISGIARQLFRRQWMHGRLWMNDPDCVIPTDRGGDHPMDWNLHVFRAATVLASGGLTLSGDHVGELNDVQAEVMAKLLPPTGTAATFDNAGFRVGRIERDGGTLLFVFNWSDGPEDFTMPVDGPVSVTDYFTGEKVGACDGEVSLNAVPPRSARVLEARPVR